MDLEDNILREFESRPSPDLPKKKVVRIIEENLDTARTFLPNSARAEEL